MEMLDRDLIAVQWSLTLMARAFRDLAASFAAIDPALADDAVRRIETIVAGEMDRLLQKPAQGITVAEMRAAIAEAIAPFRDMTQSARKLIEQSRKPKH